MSQNPPNGWATSDQMREVQEFNASLTRAGQRSRPGRPAARGSGINRGGGSGVAPGRPSNFGTQAMARPGSGSGVRADPRLHYTVGPTTAQTIIRPSTGGVRPRSRSPTRSTSTPATTGPFQAGLPPAPTVPKPASPPRIRPSVLVADGTIPTEPAVGMPHVQQQYAGPQPIVSNMVGVSNAWNSSAQLQQPDREQVRSNMAVDNTNNLWATFGQERPAARQPIASNMAGINNSQNSYSQLQRSDGERIGSNMVAGSVSNSWASSGQDQPAVRQPIVTNMAGIGSSWNSTSQQQYTGREQIASNMTMNGTVNTSGGSWAPSGPHAGRELIVSNMTASDPSKPWIPAHLQQKSAFETIRYLSNMTGIELERLTSDGVSIPGAPESRSGSLDVADPLEQRTEPQQNTALVDAHTSATPQNPTVQSHTRDEANSNTWMVEQNNNNHNGNGRVAQTTAQPMSGAPRATSYSEMDVDMDEGSVAAHANAYQVGTLEDSIWASVPAQPNGFGAARAPSATFVGQQTQPSFGATRTASTTFVGQQFQPSFGATRTASTTFPSEPAESTGSSATHTLPANVPSQQGFGGNGANNQNSSTSGSMENVRPVSSGNPGQLNSTTANFNDLLLQSLASSKPDRRLATLQDSRWA